VPAFVDANILVYAEDRDSSLKVSFWDALVLQAARVENCDRLWTEDLNHGQRIGNLLIVNPFLPEPRS